MMSETEREKERDRQRRKEAIRYLVILDDRTERKERAYSELETKGNQFVTELEAANEKLDAAKQELEAAEEKLNAAEEEWVKANSRAEQINVEIEEINKTSCEAVEDYSTCLVQAEPEALVRVEQTVAELENKIEESVNARKELEVANEKLEGAKQEREAVKEKLKAAESVKMGVKVQDPTARLARCIAVYDLAVNQALPYIHWWREKLKEMTFTVVSSIQEVTALKQLKEMTLYSPDILCEAGPHSDEIMKTCKALGLKCLICKKYVPQGDAEPTEPTEPTEQSSHRISLGHPMEKKDNY